MGHFFSPDDPRMTPFDYEDVSIDIALVAEAMDMFSIMSSEYFNYHGPKAEPSCWWVIDASQAEPEVNHPGEMISEHKTRKEALLGLARAIIEYAKAKPG